MLVCGGIDEVTLAIRWSWRVSVSTSSKNAHLDAQRSCQHEHLDQESEGVAASGRFKRVRSAYVRHDLVHTRIDASVVGSEGDERHGYARTAVA